MGGRNAPVPHRRHSLSAVVGGRRFLWSLVDYVRTGKVYGARIRHPPESNSDSGAQLYNRFCAVCRGDDLKANGPISPAFKNPPSHLNTSLTPRREIPGGICRGCPPKGREKAVAWKHGDAIMGPLFGSIRGTDPELVKIRIVNLTTSCHGRRNRFWTKLKPQQRLQRPAGRIPPGCGTEAGVPTPPRLSRMQLKRRLQAAPGHREETEPCSIVPM